MPAREAVGCLGTVGPPERARSILSLPEIETAHAVCDVTVGPFLFRWGGGQGESRRRGPHCCSLWGHPWPCSRIRAKIRGLKPPLSPAPLEDEDSLEDSLLRAVARAPDRREVSGIQLAPETVVGGRFRLERSLGEGGMGVVWRATHVLTRKPVALKFLKRGAEGDERAIQRFLREARAACAVRHPCVVEVHDVLELEDGSPVMVMELLTGETLATHLARMPSRAISLAELAGVMVHVCSAVACAHGLGIVHRDLKPENIFLADVHGKVGVKVLDFGIAKLTAPEGDAANTGGSTGTGAILGTPFYMAPEQLLGEKDIDHRADIWALGIIFYEALAGVLPTKQPNVGQIIKVVVTKAIPPLRERVLGLPEPLLKLVESMLARDRGKRPSDLREVLSVLSLYTDEPFVSVALPPMRTATSDVPNVEATLTPSSEEAEAPREAALANVDSDTARASTYDAGRATSDRLPVPGSIGVRKQRPLRLAFGLGGTVAVSAMGYFLWPAQLPRPGAPIVEPRLGGTTTPVAEVAAPVLVPTDVDPPAPVVRPASSVPEPVSVAPMPRPSARAVSPRPAFPAAPDRPSPRSTASPPPALSASARPAADPGSYL